MIQSARTVWGKKQASYHKHTLLTRGVIRMKSHLIASSCKGFEINIENRRWMNEAPLKSHCRLSDLLPSRNDRHSRSHSAVQSPLAKGGRTEGRKRIMLGLARSARGQGRQRRRNLSRVFAIVSKIGQGRTCAISAQKVPQRFCFTLYCVTREKPSSWNIYLSFITQARWIGWQSEICLRII